MHSNSTGVASFFDILGNPLISIPMALLFIVSLYIVLHNNFVKMKKRKAKENKRRGFFWVLVEIKNFLVSVFLVLKFYAQVYVYSLMVIFTFWKYIFHVKTSSIMNTEYYIALIITVVISVVLSKSKQEEITTSDVISFLRNIPSNIRGEKNDI